MTPYVFLWMGCSFLGIALSFIGVLPLMLFYLFTLSAVLSVYVLFAAVIFDGWRWRRKYLEPPDRNLRSKTGSRRSKKFRGPKKKVARDVVAQAATPPDDIETRLQRLEGLKEKGLLTDAEYQAKREEILGEV